MLRSLAADSKRTQLPDVCPGVTIPATRSRPVTINNVVFRNFIMLSAVVHSLARDRYRLLYTTFPFTIVTVTFVSRIFAGAVLKMSSDRITMSASLPGSIVPFTLS